MGLLINAAADWKNFGVIDPYFGVLANDRFKADRIDAAALDEFYASGVTHIDKVHAVLDETFGFAPKGMALDFGCGTGRLTNALAARYESVVGLDIAPGMLERARADSAKRGIDNITYANSTDPSRLQPETYDMVHTYIVLQHIPTKIGEAVIRNLVKAAKPGGVGAIHFTYGHAARPLIAGIKNLVKQTPGLREIGNLMVGRRADYPAMQMNDYAIPRVLEIFAECGVERLHSVRVDDWGNLGLFVFFEKGKAGPTWSNPKRR